jgi:hypothetical protein
VISVHADGNRVRTASDSTAWSVNRQADESIEVIAQETAASSGLVHTR